MKNKTKWNTSKQVFAKAKKTAIFKKTYNEERLRLRKKKPPTIVYTVNPSRKGASIKRVQ